MEFRYEALTRNELFPRGSFFVFSSLNPLRRGDNIVSLQFHPRSLSYETILAGSQARGNETGRGELSSRAPFAQSEQSLESTGTRAKQHKRCRGKATPG